MLFCFGSNIESFCIRKIHFENNVYKQLLFLPEFHSRSHSMRSLIESKFNIQVRVAHREPLKGVLFSYVRFSHQLSLKISTDYTSRITHRMMTELFVELLTRFNFLSM